MPAMVSVVAEKAGGDSLHPIRIWVGMATSFGLLGFLGKGTAILGSPLGMS